MRLFLRRAAILSICLTLSAKCFADQLYDIDKTFIASTFAPFSDVLGLTFLDGAELSRGDIDLDGYYSDINFSKSLLVNYATTTLYGSYAGTFDAATNSVVMHGTANYGNQSLNSTGVLQFLDGNIYHATETLFSDGHTFSVTGIVNYWYDAAANPFYIEHGTMELTMDGNSVGTLNIDDYIIPGPYQTPWHVGIGVPIPQLGGVIGIDITGSGGGEPPPTPNDPDDAQTPKDPKKKGDKKKSTKHKQHRTKTKAHITPRKLGELPPPLPPTPYVPDSFAAVPEPSAMISALIGISFIVGFRRVRWPTRQEQKRN